MAMFSRGIGRHRGRDPLAVTMLQLRRSYVSAQPVSRRVATRLPSAIRVRIKNEAVASRPVISKHSTTGATSAKASATSSTDVVREIKELEKDIFRVLCEAVPNSVLLVAFVRRLAQLGQQPSLGAVKGLADHFAASGDAQSATAVLSLLKRGSTRPVVPDTPPREDPASIMHRSVVKAYCRKRDVPRALTAVARREEETGRPASAGDFLPLLKACAQARPPLLREADAVWVHVQEARLARPATAVQPVFITRMAALARSAGYAPYDDSSQGSQQELLKEVDATWDEMAQALACAGSQLAEGGTAGCANTGVTARSWIERAACVALCARDSEAESVSAMTRSLEALRSYAAAGGTFSSDSEIVALAEVVRGLARCCRSEEVSTVLASLRNAAQTTLEEEAAGRHGGAERADLSAPARRPSTPSEKLLRALGGRGGGSEPAGPERRRANGLALLDAVEQISVEAWATGGGEPDDIDSRLTAALQAILTASPMLQSDDSALVQAAADRAVQAAEAAASGSVAGRRWAGPDVASFTLLALLRVCKNPREGVTSAVGVLQAMHDRGMSPPPSLAAQLDKVIRRHGTAGQKRRALLLLSPALEGVRSAEQDGVAGDASPLSGHRGQQHRQQRQQSASRIGDDIRSMVARAARGVDEWAPKGNASDVSLNRPPSEPGSQVAASEGSGNVEDSYRTLRRRMDEATVGSGMAPGARSIERACVIASTVSGSASQDGHAPAAAAAAPAVSHERVFARVTALAAQGRAHAALQVLQEVDGRKRGARATVPRRVYSAVFRALAHNYSARGSEELELAASPAEALQWLLRSMAREGYEPDTTILNFGLDAFAAAARTRRVRTGGDRVKRRVCTEAMDFIAGMGAGWDELHEPVPPDVFSYSILIKVLCRLELFDEAFETLDAMERNGCTPDRVTFSTLIHGLSKVGDNDGAWEVLVAMTNKGITPHSIAVDGIVNGYVRSGEVGEAISFAQHAFNQYGCPPTPANFCRVIHAAADLDDGKHEARRAVTVAEQMWKDEWKGDGPSSHPILGHPDLKELLRERGVFEPVGFL